MECTNGCIINSQVGGDHAYCECRCHVGSLPAVPPSRERRAVPKEVSKSQYALLPSEEEIYALMEIITYTIDNKADGIRASSFGDWLYLKDADLDNFEKAYVREQEYIALAKSALAKIGG